MTTVFRDSDRACSNNVLFVRNNGDGVQQTHAKNARAFTHNECEWKKKKCERIRHCNTVKSIIRKTTYARDAEKSNWLMDTNDVFLRFHLFIFIFFSNGGGDYKSRVCGCVKLFVIYQWMKSINHHHVVSASTHAHSLAPVRRIVPMLPNV